jgi:hypothetical protein
MLNSGDTSDVLFAVEIIKNNPSINTKRICKHLVKKYDWRIVNTASWRYNNKIDRIRKNVNNHWIDISW